MLKDLHCSSSTLRTVSLFSPDLEAIGELSYILDSALRHDRILKIGTSCEHDCHV